MTARNAVVVGLLASHMESLSRAPIAPIWRARWRRRDASMWPWWCGAPVEWRLRCWRGSASRCHRTRCVWRGRSQVCPAASVATPASGRACPQRLTCWRRTATAVRDVINVSGDGKETLSPQPRSHVPLDAARARARTMGVTINDLAITSDHPDLAQCYADRVIVGQDAFVMQVTGFETFAAALQAKLAREMRPPMVALGVLEPAPVAPP